MGKKYIGKYNTDCNVGQIFVNYPTRITIYSIFEYIVCEQPMSPMVTTPLTTEHALLGFLLEQPMHGYEIHRRLSEAEGLGLVWRLKQNQLYALLAKLERQEYVTVTLQPQENRPARKIYHPTAAGRAAFSDWLRSPVRQGRKLRLDFLAKLYFARRQNGTLALELVQNQLTSCRQWLHTEHLRLESVANNRPFDRLVHQFRIGQLQAMIDWLAVCGQELAAESER
jgi:DNA-binding PadR family transcriptional regulator